MRIRSLTLLLALVLGATPAAIAEVSKKFTDWAAGPVVFLMTPAEREAWQAVTDDRGADAFVRLFWAKRDPTPETPANEYRDEFEGRVLYADPQFQTRDKRGSMTHRGQTFVVFGPPFRALRPSSRGTAQGGDAGPFQSEVDGEGSVAGGTGPGQFGTGGQADRAGVSSQETWIYEKDRKPKAVKQKKLEVKFRSQPGADDMVFERADNVLGLLADEAALAVTRPDLTAEQLLAQAAPAAPPAGATGAPGTPAAPVAPAVPSAWKAEPVADPALTARLREKAGTVDAAAAIDAAPFQSSNGFWIVPVQVSVPATSPLAAAVALVGEVDNGGQSVLGFHSKQSWVDSMGRRQLQQTLVLPPGENTIRVGLVDAQNLVVWAGTKKVVVPSGEAASKFWLSELVLADDIHPLPAAQQALDPWAWQGIAVVPKGDNVFPQGDALWYYVHVCNATAGPQGPPELKVMVELTGPKKFRGAAQIQPAMAGPNCWILAEGLDLLPDRFVPGDYQLKLDVTDAATSSTLSASRSFKVVAGG